MWAVVSLSEKQTALSTVQVTIYNIRIEASNVAFDSVLLACQNTSQASMRHVRH